MYTEEIEAAEEFHSINEKIDKLVLELTDFNKKEPDNINTEKADLYRKDLLELNRVADRLFKIFVYSKPRQN